MANEEKSEQRKSIREAQRVTWAYALCPVTASGEPDRTALSPDAVGLGYSPSGTALWGTEISDGIGVGCARISLEVSEDTPVTAQPAQLAAAPPVPGLDAAWTSFSGQ